MLYFVFVFLFLRREAYQLFVLAYGREAALSKFPEIIKSSDFPAFRLEKVSGKGLMMNLPPIA